MYVNYDISTLKDVFENLRNNNFKNHELCPSHYLSAPDINSNSMLEMTKIQLELIICIYIYIYIYIYICMYTYVYIYIYIYIYILRKVHKVGFLIIFLVNTAKPTICI